MMFISSVLLFALGVFGKPLKEPRNCPAVSHGDFVIDQYQLYPENADWDEDRCIVWFGAVWNASVVAYDPYERKVLEIIEFPGITNSISEHIGGVAWDPFTGLLTILVDSAPPWATNGQDVSGDNLIMKYNPDTKKILWNLNITAVSNGVYGGFQDVETDREGNTYIVGTWPGTIMKVDPQGKAVTPWYLPATFNTTQKGYAGLVTVGHYLLANDGDGQIYRFDTRDKMGKPVLVNMTPRVNFNDLDAIYAPPKYGGTVLLVASHGAGIQVLRTEDLAWEECKHIGVIPKPNDTLSSGATPVAAVQMGNNAVYFVNDFFGDTWVTGQAAGNRTLFPMYDITAQIEKFIDAC